MNIRCIIPLLFLLCSILLDSCSENMERSQAKQESHNAYMINAFSDNSTVFSEIFYYFKFTNLIDITFREDSSAYMVYSLRDSGNNSSMKQMRVPVPGHSQETEAVLQANGFTHQDLLKLKFYLTKINCNRISFIQNKDEEGIDAKELLLMVNKFDDTSPVYYFRIYQRRLDSAAVDPGFLTNNYKTGGKLSDHVIWYFKWKP